MAEFKVGGKVICVKQCTLISNTKESYTYNINQTYTISEVKICSCGSVSLWLGDVRVGTGKTFTQCPCKKKTETFKVFAHSLYFLPLDDFKEVTFEKIKEQVPVSAQ